MQRLRFRITSNHLNILLIHDYFTNLILSRHTNSKSTFLTVQLHNSFDLTTMRTKRFNYTILFRTWGHKIDQCP